MNKRGNPSLGKYAIDLGQKNMETIREWCATHPFGTKKECAAALGLNVSTVGKHAKNIRAEWRK